MRLPPCCVTGVGSLPFDDVDEAVRFVAAHAPILPFWPQLPQRALGEGMIAQCLGRRIEMVEPALRPGCWAVRSGSEEAFAASLENEAGLIPATAAGFFAFEAGLQAGSFPQAAAVKGQAMGPATLAHCLLSDGQPIAFRSGGIERVAAYLAEHATWQIARLRRVGKPVVFVFDEPALGFALSNTETEHVASIEAAIVRVLAAARAAGAIVGLHCCAPLPWETIARFDLDLLSFDVHLPIGDGSEIRCANAALARLKYVAFGMVSTEPSAERNESTLLEQWQRLTDEIGDLRDVACKTIVTATCGLGLATPAEAARIFDCCRRLGDGIRRIVAPS